jgi:hypothetical protein
MHKKIARIVSSGFYQISTSACTDEYFKHQKSDLVKNGFDPERVGDDAIYFFDWKKNTPCIIEKQTFV